MSAGTYREATQASVVQEAAGAMAIALAKVFKCHGNDPAEQAIMGAAVVLLLDGMASSGFPAVRVIVKDML